MATVETPIKSEDQSDAATADGDNRVNDQTGHDDESQDDKKFVVNGDGGGENIKLETDNERQTIKVETNDGGDDNNGETGDSTFDPNNAQLVVAGNEDEDATISNDGNNNDMQIANTNEKTNLIVNYLPQHMTDEEFEELFKKFGSMKSCKIVRNRSTGYSYGFGFVDFDTHEQAIKAIDELNGHELDNKKIKVAFARPAGQDIKQANLYIKNVPNEWTQDDVRRVFEPFGKIIQARVLGNNRGIAFVLFDLRKQAEDALEAMNGKKLDECESPFEIKFAADKKVEGGASGGGGSNKGNNTSSAVVAGGAGGAKTGRRERGHRGGRNRNRDRDPSKQRSGSQGGGPGRNGSNQRSTSNSGGSFFNRQQDRRGGGGNQSNNNNNNNHYGNNDNQMQYNNNNNNNNMNSGFGPIRQQPNRMNRYAPFVQQQLPLSQMSVGAGGMMPAAQLAPAAAYGYPQQQPMMPTYMMAAGQPTLQMQAMPQHQQHPSMTQAPQTNHPAMQMNPIASAYQLPAPMGSVTHQMPTMSGYAPVTQDAMNNIYNVASNTMQNAAQLQPQLGQPMSMRHQHQTSSSSSNHNNNNNNNSSMGDDGTTLFVYNIGPNFDEDELRQMFAPYGQVVKCNVVRKTPGGETKGFGFVTLKTKEQANSSIAGLNGSMKFGRTLQVSLKK